MTDNESILAELRRIGAWADLQRKMTKSSLIFVAVVVPGVIGIGVFMQHRLKTNLETPGLADKPDWYEVDRNVRQGNFDKAIQMGEEMMQKTPLYPEAHRRLATAYLAAGKIEKAREHYAEAFLLFPSEENEKLVVAIDKRITAETTREECSRNMTMLWSAAASYCLEHRTPAGTLIPPAQIRSYFRDGKPPHCPLGEVDYAPFTVESGPRCPHRSDVHLTPAPPEKAKGVG